MTAEFRVPTSAVIAYRWQCAKCGVEELESRRVPRGGVPYLPAYPAGWRKLDDRDLCPAHKITVLVDGKVFE